MKHKVLISGCLFGEKVRYDGNHCFLSHPAITAWRIQNIIIPFCPEMAGGLPVPRPAAEITGGDGLAVWNNAAQVITKDGDTVTQAFKLGAQHCLAVAQKNHIKLAVLKSKSPSCGAEEIYDGSFSDTMIEGEGVTAALLLKQGVRVFNECQLEQAYQYWLDLAD